jgi:hypothetical protein
MSRPLACAVRVAAHALAALLLFPTLAPSAPAAPAGRVLSISGEVVAASPRGPTRVLQARSRVYPGDTLRTEADERVRIRFVDGALLELRAASRFTVKRYGRSPDEAVVLRLSTGALRTLTGEIGGGSEGRYRMETPVASIGVRGTDYELGLCVRDCGAGQESGLYVRVGDGAIVVRNEAGEQVVETGEYAFVDGDAGEPLQTLPVPDAVFGVRTTAHAGR